MAVNKVDDFGAEKGADEFAQLGFEKILPVSAIHGEGIEDLMEAAVALLPPSDAGRSGDAPRWNLSPACD